MSLQGRGQVFRVATLDDIEANNDNLSIPLYVKRAMANSNVASISESIATWRASSSDLHVAAESVLRLMEAKERGP